MLSASNDRMLGIKLSRNMKLLMVLQSSEGSPSMRHIDSRAIFTGTGGLLMDRTSTRCCRFIFDTAIDPNRMRQGQSDIKEAGYGNYHAQTCVILAVLLCVLMSGASEAMMLRFV